MIGSTKRERLLFKAVVGGLESLNCLWDIEVILDRQGMSRVAKDG